MTAAWGERCGDRTLRAVGGERRLRGEARGTLGDGPSSSLLLLGDGWVLLLSSSIQNERRELGSGGGAVARLVRFLTCCLARSCRGSGRVSGNVRWARMREAMLLAPPVITPS